MATDWSSYNWTPTLSFALPNERQLAQSSLADAGKGAEFKFAPTDKNAQLLGSLGYSGEMFSNSGPDYGFGSSPAWSDAARTWLANSGYNVGVAHDPGSSPNGRPEYYGLTDPTGKFVGGQDAPTMTMSDSLMDQITPFLMLAGPFASAISTAEGLAAAGGAAGASGGSAASGLSGAADGVTALGSQWSPQSLGLTGAITPGTTAAEISSLASGIPGAVEVGAGVGGAAAAAGGGGGGSAAAGGGGSFSPSMNYGPGMNGLQTSAYDSTLGMTGSKAAADVVANSSLGSSILRSPITKGIAESLSNYGSGSGWEGLVKGALSLYQSSQLSDKGQPSAAARTAGDQLAALLADPASLTKLPGYEAGIQAVQRSGAANGYLGSGNMAVGLSKYAGDFYNNTLRQLSAIANEGRGIDQQYNFASTEMLGNAINNFGYGLTKLFGD